MPNIDHQHVQEILQRLLCKAGTPEDIADIVATSLVDANLAGHDSHGLIRIVQYLDQVEAGVLDPSARPTVIRENGATVVVDAAWGWGQPAMRLAAEEATAKASEFGLGLGVVERCYHIGRVAPYVELAASQGMIALAMANAGPAVAPYAGRTRVLGTNPIAWAVPRQCDPPISFDVATSVVAEGKLRVAKAKGFPAPEGAVITCDGMASVDPNDFYNGGALMTCAGHKGSGLSILAQLLGSSLAGMTPERVAAGRGGNGPVIIVINPEFIAPLEQFSMEIERQAEAILSAEPAEGFDKVQLPGNPELAERQRREATGIEIADATWEELRESAAKLDIDLDRLAAAPVN